MNKALPSYIKVKEGKYVNDKVKSLQAIVNTAIYRINFDYKKDLVDDNRILKDIKSQDKIEIIRKRRNKKDRKLDLKPMIYEIKVADNKPVWTFTVSTGSSGNVRPSELIRALAERYDKIKEVPLVNVVREKMLVKKKDKFFKPFARQVVRS